MCAQSFVILIAKDITATSIVPYTIFDAVIKEIKDFYGLVTLSAQVRTQAVKLSILCNGLWRIFTS